MTHHREELPPIKYRELADALLPMAETLVPQWLPGGQRVGHEWKCGSLAGEAGGSCSVNLVTGQWADFAGADDEKGNDLLGLYAAIHNLSAAKAAVQLARQLGLESVAGLVKASTGAALAPVANPRPAPPPKKPAPEKERWTPVCPVPSIAPRFTFTHYHYQREALQDVAEYRDGDDLLGYVLRYATSDGGKVTLPFTFGRSDRDGSLAWKQRSWNEPRPLFLAGGKRPGERTVILVEGEVKAKVLQALLDEHMPGLYCVISWVGGCKGWTKVDWSWLAGCTVIQWPDCDAHREKLSRAEQASVKDDPVAHEALQASKPILPEAKQPGTKAMQGIGLLLRDTHGCTVSRLPIPKPGAKPSGWDCKDAIVDEGWTFEDVLAFFGKAQPLPTADADKTAVVSDAPEKKSRSLVGTKGGGSSDSAGGGDGEGSAGKDETPPPKGTPPWLRPYWDKQKARWNISRKTVIAALEHDESLQGVVAFNELTNSIQCRKAWPWPHARPGEIKGVDGLLLGKYLTDYYSLPSVSQAALQEGVQTVAHTERFHPIREKLVGLKWDDKTRIDNWLIFVLGETPESLNPALREYLSLVGRFWLLGMVWRVMEPGCKFDYCPVLEGVGGLRKSTLVEVLCGKDYFSDTPFDMSRGKEAQEQVQGIWLYEIAELSALSKGDVNAIKAFISSKVDKYRPAYGATVESYPRQCVLVGTTNDDQYLRDRTGNRRFWPVPVRHQINTEWVQKYRDQLFAEAFALYQQGVAYTPTADQEKRLFAPMQDSRLIETAVETRLMFLLTRGVENAAGSDINEDAKFVVIDRLVVALGADVAKSTAGLEGQIRGWLKQQGWKHGKKQLAPGYRPSGYYRPAEWPPVGAVEGLDQIDCESEAQAADAAAVPQPAPDGQVQSEAPPPLTPAAQWVQDRNQADDDTPF